MEFPIPMCEEEYRIEVYGQKTQMIMIGSGSDELTDIYEPKPGDSDVHQEPLMTRGDCHLRFAGCTRRVKAAIKKRQSLRGGSL